MANRRDTLRTIASTTLAALEKGYYVHKGVRHELKSVSDMSVQNTYYCAPDELDDWEQLPAPSSTTSVSAEKISTEILEISTMAGIRYITNMGQTDSTHSPRNQDDATPTIPTDNPITNKDDPICIGILNFASATKPGGGFINGAQAQEESLARSSSLYPTLMCQAGAQFHNLHKKDKKGGYYTHAMVYSPGVVFFRDDAGSWEPPVRADVLTSAAVNAGVVRRTLFGRVGGAKEEARIEAAMRERMGRILYLFERERVRHLVLGSFGTGVFQNRVEMVARVWANLLAVPGARFEHSFDKVVFAVLGRETFDEFRTAFTKTCHKAAGAGTNAEAKTVSPDES